MGIPSVGFQIITVTLTMVMRNGLLQSITFSIKLENIKSVVYVKSVIYLNFIKRFPGGWIRLRER